MKSTVTIIAETVKKITSSFVVLEDDSVKAEDFTDPVTFMDMQIMAIIFKNTALSIMSAVPDGDIHLVHKNIDDLLANWKSLRDTMLKQSQK